MVDPILLAEQIISFIGLYVIVTIGLNIKAGVTGIPDFGHAMFFAMGGIVVGNIVAHIAAALASMVLPDVNVGRVLADNTRLMAELNEKYFPTHPLESILLLVIAIVLSVLLGGLLGWIASYPGLRLRGEYLAILLLSVAEALRIFVTYTTWIMGNTPTVGLSTPDLFAWTGNSGLAVTVFTLVVAVGVYIYAERLHHSPAGRLFRAVRDDEDAAKALGKDVSLVRRDAMIIGSALAGLAGAIYALNPWYGGGAVAAESIFNRVWWTFWPWALMILGGMASNKGIGLATVIVGVLLIWPIRIYKNVIASALRVQTVGIDPGFFASALEYLLLGVLIILVLFLRPQGIVPEYVSRTTDFERIALDKGIPITRTKSEKGAGEEKS
ncbi:MAG: branched-chain amino acid ABC transporter permease [Pyrodictiaceae archaeon]